MTPDRSRLLNALGLMAIDTVLVLAFVDQLWFRDIPCALCILQRAGFFTAGFGIALNLVSGPRPSHYGLTILGAATGAAGSVRQILLHIVPGSGAYGNAIFDLHLYTWALIAFALIIVGTAVMLLFDRQFVTTEWQAFRPRVLPISAFMVFAALAVANVLHPGNLRRRALPRDSRRLSLIQRQSQPNSAGPAALADRARLAGYRRRPCGR